MKKSNWRDWIVVLSLGLGAMLIYHLSLGVVALGIGWIVSLVSDVPWYVGTLIAYFVIRIIAEATDSFPALRSTRCPKCKRPIKTTRSVPCVECGGAALLVQKKRRDV